MKTPFETNSRNFLWIEVIEISKEEQGKVDA
jgi:hypothetical protein